MAVELRHGAFACGFVPGVERGHSRRAPAAGGHEAGQFDAGAREVPRHAHPRRMAAEAFPQPGGTRRQLDAFGELVVAEPEDAGARGGPVPYRREARHGRGGNVDDRARAFLVAFRAANEQAARPVVLGHNVRPGQCGGFRYP